MSLRLCDKWDTESLEASMHFGMLIDTADSHLPGVSFESNSCVDNLMWLWNLVGLIQVDIVVTRGSLWISGFQPS